MSVKEQALGWRPPVRNLGGEDIPEYFAHLLTEETLSMLAIKKRSMGLPILGGMDVVVEYKTEVADRMRVGGHYFYKGGGSIFMDYKTMRDEGLRRLGKKAGETDPQKLLSSGNLILLSRFADEMTTDKALAIVREFVTTWDWDKRH